MQVWRAAGRGGAGGSVLREMAGWDTLGIFTETETPASGERINAIFREAGANDNAPK